LTGVSLQVETGELVAVVGRSGSGKSTFLRCLNGLETPDQGQITIAGHSVNPDAVSLRALRQDVGMVFQSYNLFPHLTVGRNIELAPMRVLGLSPSAARDVALSVLAEVGLETKYGAYPEQLSGGQQQRVAIARAMAMQPTLMLFDEPTSALDPELVGEVLEVIRSLALEGMTMLVVTHEMQFAREVGTRILFMDHGRVIEDTTPDQFFTNPAHGRAREFLRRTLKTEPSAPL
jgi:ABC-type polar amino acid transport system ATPase subunit